MKTKRNVRRPTIKRATVPKKPATRGDVAGEGGDMSNRLRRELKILKDHIAQNTRVVEQRLAQTGTAPGGAFVASAAKYYPTLKKLAEK